MKKTSLVYLAVIIVIAVFVLIIYQVKTISGSKADMEDIAKNELAIAAYKENCSRCHGENGQGYGANPTLIDNDYPVEELKNIIQNGLDQMPAFPNIKEPTKTQLAGYVAGL